MIRSIGLPVVILISCWLLTGPLTSQLEVNADTERDLFRTAHIVEHHQWPKSGPAIDHFPLTLGPGWYLATAPAIAISRNPVTVHYLHVALLCLGLIALFSALEPIAGDGAAITACLLIATSAHSADVLSRIWHNAMLPGLTLVWFWLLYIASTHMNVKLRSYALASGWLLTSLMLQLHLVSVAYLATWAMLQLFHWRKHGLAGGKLSAGISALIGIALVISTSLTLLSLQWDAIAQIKAERSESELSIAAMIQALPLLLQSAWSAVNTAWLGWGVLFFSVVGIVCSATATSPEVMLNTRSTTFGRWVTLQVALGLPCVAALSGLDTAARYFTGITPGIYVLAALGLGQFITRVGPTLTGPLVFILVLAASMWGQSPGSNSPNDHRADATLTLLEQQAVLKGLHETHGLAFKDLKRRVHGPFFGPMSATRYLAWVEGMTQLTSSTGLEDGEEIVILPPGFEMPKAQLAQGKIGVKRGRSLSWIKRKARLDYSKIATSVAGVLCPIPIPYHWSHLTKSELKPFGIHPSFDLERCRKGDSPLKMKLSRVRGKAPLYLMLSWYDLVSNYDETASVTVKGGQIERLSGPMYAKYAVYKIKPKQSKSMTITVAPIQTLASIDLF